MSSCLISYFQLIRSVSFIEGPLDKLLNNFSQLWFQNSCPWFLFQGAEWPEFMVGDKNVAKKWQTCARAKLVPGIFRRNWITRPRSGHNFRFSTFKLFITTVQSPDKRSTHSCDNLSLLSLRWYCWQCWRGHVCFNSMNCFLQALVVQALVLPIFCLSALP